MMDFIKKEITEGRLIRGINDIKGKNIAQQIMNHVLVLEILAQADPNYAARYARQTLSYGDYKGIRSNATDLYNLLSIAENKDRYSKDVPGLENLTVPTLQINQYLRNLTRKSSNREYTSQMMYRLQRSMGVNDSRTSSVRRVVQDWGRALDNERAQAVDQLNRMMMADSRRSDLYDRYAVLGKAAKGKKGIPLWQKMAAGFAAGYAAGKLVG